MEGKATAQVKDNRLLIDVPFSIEGKTTMSRKNVLHATTEANTDDALTIQLNGKKIIIQVNAWSRREPKPLKEAKKEKKAQGQKKETAPVTA